MELTQPQYEQIAHVFPRPRGNVSFSHLAVLNAILYVAEHGCKWRGLPAHFGNWHTIYTRMNPLGEERGAGPGVRRVAAPGEHSCEGRGPLARQHGGEGAPGWDGCAQKNGPQAIGKSRGGWSTKLHLVAADARSAIGFSLSAGQAGDAPQGRELLPIPCCRARRVTWSWIRPMKAMPPVSSSLTRGLSRLSRRRRIGCLLGTMTESCTRGAMKSNVCSGD